MVYLQAQRTTVGKPTRPNELRGECDFIRNRKPLGVWVRISHSCRRSSGKRPHPDPLGRNQLSSLGNVEGARQHLFQTV